MFIFRGKFFKLKKVLTSTNSGPARRLALAAKVPPELNVLLNRTISSVNTKKERRLEKILL